VQESSVSELAYLESSDQIAFLELATVTLVTVTLVTVMVTGRSGFEAVAQQETDLAAHFQEQQEQEQKTAERGKVTRLVPEKTQADFALAD
jgi:hypothetical protein